MVNLPIELWHSIFDHLDLIDLPSCALISKALYSAVRAYLIREISFTRRVYEWFNSDFSTYQYWVDYSMASLLTVSSFNLEHLKRLQIGRCSTIDDLNRINKFAHLEELDIDLANYRNDQSRTLSLANLKVLYLFMPEHLAYLELDTPKLAKVCTLGLESLEFLHPDSVRCIHTLFPVEKLSMFQNLEYLHVTDCYSEKSENSDERYSLKSFKDFNLTALKKLKEIEFCFVSGGFASKNWSKIKKMVRNILALERPDLKVFWYGVQVIEPNLLTRFEEAPANVGGLSIFQLKHFKKLKEKVDYSWEHDFNESMSNLAEAGFDLKSEEFASKFFARFSFQMIEVDGEVKYPELLIELIARSPRLWSLKFFGSDLSQSFFDRMAETIQMNGIPLFQFTLEGHSNENLNFDFVLRLCHLELFGTDQQLPNEFISKMLRRCRPTDIKHGSNEEIIRLSTNKFLRNGEVASLQELLRQFDSRSDSGSDSKTDSRSGFRAKCVLM